MINTNNPYTYRTIDPSEIVNAYQIVVNGNFQITTQDGFSAGVPISDLTLLSPYTPTRKLLFLQDNYGYKKGDLIPISNTVTGSHYVLPNGQNVAMFGMDNVFRIRIYEGKGRLNKSIQGIKETGTVIYTSNYPSTNASLPPELRGNQPNHRGASSNEDEGMSIGTKVMLAAAFIFIVYLFFSPNRLKIDQWKTRNKKENT